MRQDVRHASAALTKRLRLDAKPNGRLLPLSNVGRGVIRGLKNTASDPLSRRISGMRVSGPALACAENVRATIDSPSGTNAHPAYRVILAQHAQCKGVRQSVLHLRGTASIAARSGASARKIHSLQPEFESVRHGVGGREVDEGAGRAVKTLKYTPQPSMGVTASCAPKSDTPSKSW